MAACGGTPPPVSAPVPKGIETKTIKVPGTDFEIEMVRLPGGRFKMGSPEGEAGRGADEFAPEERELKPFWISRYEVSWELFSRYFASREEAKTDGVTRPSTPYMPPNGPMKTGPHPAINMRWHGAIQFCRWLSRKTGLAFRLPTEAEWEYACRAGSDLPAPAPLGDHAWHEANSGEMTQKPGGKKPNAFGLHDMLGNVWEYCLEPMKPGVFAPVLRGGSWADPAAELRAANRQGVKPEWHEKDPQFPKSMWWCTDAFGVGLRLVTHLEPVDPPYAPKIETANLKVESGGDFTATVTGEIRNTGDRTLEEVELTVFYLDENGKPLLADLRDRPAFNRCYPVLATSVHPGEHRKPLPPGKSRRFKLIVPQPFDYNAHVSKVGAKVTALRLYPRK
jgi:formylglycine-generating enzyme required for sulfatase activity